MRFKFLFFFCERFPGIYISILADSEMKKLQEFQESMFNFAITDNLKL